VHSFPLPPTTTSWTSQTSSLQASCSSRTSVNVSHHLSVKFIYKKYANTGKPDGTAESEVDKIDINTFDRFLSTSQRFLQLHEDTELADLQCKLLKTHPWRDVGTPALYDTLQAEMKERELKSKHAKMSTIWISSKVRSLFLPPPTR